MPWLKLDKLRFVHEVGWRLASLADGEGHFSIGKINDCSTFTCAFRIKLRADDVDILKRFQAYTGVGTITRATKGRHHPCRVWSVQKKSDLLHLIDIFDIYPLWSKKQRDYEIWRDAVLYWNTPERDEWGRIEWGPMEDWYWELRAVRQYVEPATEQALSTGR